MVFLFAAGLGCRCENLWSSMALPTEIAHEITGLQDRRTREWHQPEGETGRSPSLPAGSDSTELRELLAGVERQHQANFELWHIEDEARRTSASDAEIADVKRRIDRTNQRRNDLAEALDLMLLEWLKARDLPCPAAPLNSESPGLIVDRLSILSLKIFHTREELERRDAPEGHAERNRGRLAILEEQRSDLAGCLDELWQQTLEGTRRFRLYRQLKMYNDPLLNPAMYSERSQ